MGQILSLVLIIGGVIIGIFIIRWLGAWMLRIDEVIKELKLLNDHFRSKE